MNTIKINKALRIGNYILASISNGHPAFFLKNEELISLVIGDDNPIPAHVVAKAKPRPTIDDFDDMRKEIDYYDDPFMLVGFEVMSKHMFKIIETLLADNTDINEAYGLNNPDYVLDGGDYACYLLFKIGEPNVF